ncbi:ribonuclease J [Bacillus sp. CGMCC 1.16541]|uniref:ribonuclease J n=1 Tax=Bacillus sp. CGMCC 1.16541 TaxID=2185143 RepID=UPI0023B8685B|nr:ribonuclease J [Bacillus sp. CGMCC 1.16541]
MSQLSVFALGGLNEVGKNMYVIESEHDILVIDCGNKFPDESLLGIDLIIPDVTYLEKHKEKVKALIVTHGHEDHIGGIAYFLKKVNVPVYATRFTLGLIELKLEEHKLLGETELFDIHSDSHLTFTDMEVDFFKVNHSIPDCLGIAFKTSQGTIVHTGDFKFDLTPMNNEYADLHKIAHLGEEGVQLLLSESTNAERPGFTPSERIVGEHMVEAFKKAKGKVIVSTFASNVNRVQQVIDACKATRRKLALLGRSMVNVVDVAIERGYLHVPKAMLISAEQINELDSKKVAILCTGSQGEPLAALARLSNGTYRGVEVYRGDTVILAAGPIPGNERSVSRIVDNMFALGANVIYGTGSSTSMHVSGHGYQEDLKLMLSLIKPTYFIPIHGEYRMLHHHCLLAESVGVEEKNMFILKNGDVVDLEDGEARQTRNIQAGNTYVDGVGVGDVGEIILKDRKQLAEDGMLVIILTMSKAEKKLISTPDLVTRGFVYVKESEVLLKNMTKLITSTVNDMELVGHRREWNEIKQNVKRSVNQYVYTHTKRRPMILPIIIEV